MDHAVSWQSKFGSFLEKNVWNPYVYILYEECIPASGLCDGVQGELEDMRDML